MNEQINKQDHYTFFYKCKEGTITSVYFTDEEAEVWEVEIV